MSKWLGFDFGTQGVRGIALSESGSVLGRSSHPLTSRREGLRHEQQPEEWWQAFVRISRAVLSEAPKHSVEGLAIDGTSGSILLVNNYGEALTAGLMYDDLRAVEEARQIDQSGCWSHRHRIQASWALPKLLWLLRERRGVAPGVRVAHQVDFINGQLAGCNVPTDSSNALKTGYDLERDSWPREIFLEQGLPEEILPDVVCPGTRIGSVCAGASAMTGIPQGTPIVAGMTDGCAAQIAAGALELGSWNSVLGTTLVLKGVSKEALLDPAGVIYSHRSPDGNWLPGAASSTGAGALTSRFANRDLDVLTRRAAERCQPSKLIAYPLIGRGERFPFVSTDAEGFVLGEPSNEIDLFAAVLEGVSYIERLCFEYFEMLGASTDGELTLTGGAVRNRYWCQLRADVLGRPVCLPEHGEPAFGMAVLAASAGRSISQVARHMVRIREVIDPRPDAIARFHQPYLLLVDELEHRGWLPATVAEYARHKTTFHNAS